MGSHLSVATVIEKNRIASAVAFVVALEIDVVDPADQSVVETQRIVENTEPITFQGNVYSPARFELSITRTAGEQVSLTLTAYDYTRTIQSRMEEYGGGIGFEVRAMMINTGNLLQPPEIMEAFSVVGAKNKDYRVDFTLGAENPLAQRFPFRMQFKDRCQWVFKGAECKYVGADATCDYTLQGANGCGLKNNSLNFGAFPGIRNSE